MILEGDLPDSEVAREERATGVPAALSNGTGDTAEAREEAIRLRIDHAVRTLKSKDRFNRVKSILLEDAELRKFSSSSELIMRTTREIYDRLMVVVEDALSKGPIRRREISTMLGVGLEATAEIMNEMCAASRAKRIGREYTGRRGLGEVIWISASYTDIQPYGNGSRSIGTRISRLGTGMLVTTD